MIKSVNGLFKVFGGPSAMGRAMGFTDHVQLERFHIWKFRQRIPPDNFPEIIRVAKKAGIEGVDYDTLYNLKSAKK